jgi:hypothetical protein
MLRRHVIHPAATHLIVCMAFAVSLIGCASAPTRPPEPTASKPPAAAPTDRLAAEAEKYANSVDKSLTRSQPQTPAAAQPSTLPPPEVEWANLSPAALKPVDPKQGPPKPADLAATTAAEKTAAVARPAKAPTEMTTAELLKGLGDKLKHEKLGALRPFLARAALSMMDPQLELSENDLTDLGEEDRRIVLAYQQAFTMLGKSLGADPAVNRAQAKSVAEELLAKIGGEKRLSIRGAKLCTKVNGYGVYSVFESNSFLAGKEQPMIVYAELDHFSSATEDEQQVVRLTQQITLYNDVDGLAVWKVKPTQIIDRSRNKRRDFFVVQIVNLPSRLTVGKYQLKLQITDEVGQAVDEVAIPIQIVADNELAGGGGK